MESKVENLIKKYKSIIFAEEHLRKVEERIGLEFRRLKELELIVEKEYADVIKMNSLRAVFSKMLGKDKIEKENQEYLHAVLEYKESKEVLSLLEFEKKVLSGKIVDKVTVENELNQVLLKEKDEILKRYPLHGKDLISIEEKLIATKFRINELNLPLEIAEKGRKKVEMMQKHLSYAKYNGSWGSGSTSEQNGLMKMKNSRIDQAHKLSYEVKLILQELEDDLSQCSFISSSEIKKFRMLESFNYVYYDKLISDWIVHSKIVSSIKYLLKINRDIQELAIKIRTEKERLEKYTISLIEKRDKILKQS